MTKVYAVGFETGDATEMTAVGGAPAYTTTYQHSGSYSLRTDSSGEEGRQTITGIGHVWIRGYFMIRSLPTNNTVCAIMQLLGTGGTDPIAQVYFARSSGGTRQFWIRSYYPAHYTYINYAFETDVWYCVELDFYDNAAGHYMLYVNDALIGTYSANTAGAPNVDQVRFGQCFSSYTVTNYTDDIVVDNAALIGSMIHDFEEKFEAGFSAWTAQTDSPTESVSRKHCGSKSMCATVAQWGSAGVYLTIDHNKELWLQLFVEFDNLPTDGEYIEFAKLSGDGTNVLQLRLRNNGGTYEWGYVYRAGGVNTAAYDGVNATNPLVDTWYGVEVHVRCDHEDAGATGIYQMWIENIATQAHVLLADIDQAAVDTDIMGIDTLSLVTTTDTPGGCAVYTDCVILSDTDPAAFHVAGSEDDPTPSAISEPADCNPVGGVGWLQVFQNCTQVGIYSLSLKGEQNGIASLTVPYSTVVNEGDLFHVIVDGTRLVQGDVTHISPDRKAGVKTLLVQTKSARLYTRYMRDMGHILFESQDAGAIVDDVVDQYFSGLFTTTNINENTGVIINSIDGSGKTVGDFLDELCTLASAALAIDEDNNVSFWLTGEESSGLTVGPDDIVEIKPVTVGEPVNKIIVVGDNCEGSAGTGIPERLITERRIKSDLVAQQYAELLLASYGFGHRPRRTTVTVNKYVYAPRGKTIVLDSPRDGYVNETVVVAEPSWTFAPGRVSTTLVLGEPEASLEWMFKALTVQKNQEIIAYIDDHSGSDVSDADPVLLYEEILHTAVSGAHVVDDSTEHVIQTGACASVTSPAVAATLAQIEVTLARTADGATTNFHVYAGAVAAANRVDSRALRPDASNVDHSYRILVAQNLEGVTINLTGTSMAGATVTVTGHIVVKQYLQHGHSLSQAMKHIFGV